MSRYPMLRFASTAQVLSVFLLILFSTNSILVAQGFKNRIKGVLGKKDKQAVDVSEVTAEVEIPVALRGMRNVLLVSSPRHHAKIPPNSTIAFIEFNHIAHKITVDIKKDICAAQVAAALAQHLSDLNEFKVVTRDHIGSVLEEQNFANSGSFDSSTAAKLGELIGADILIYGQVQICASSASVTEVGQASGSQPLESNPGVADSLAGVAAREVGNRVLGSRSSDILGRAVEGLVGSRRRKAGNGDSQDAESSATYSSFVLAQIQLIEADTGQQVFTTSLEGRFKGNSDEDDSNLLEHELLIAKASDDLANRFIDDFLARREEYYIGLYDDQAWGFGNAIELIRLGDCAGAERHLASLYDKFKYEMSDDDIARLMYNHGISLMCANRSKEALSRLWASLRLSNTEATFDAIKFANDTVDRGREIMSEEDPIIQDIRGSLYSVSTP